MTEAAKIARRKPATIRQWVARGHLIPRKVRGRQKVEASAVLDVERETRKRARAGRRPTRPQ
jgi:hypothetical protein